MSLLSGGDECGYDTDNIFVCLDTAEGGQVLDEFLQGRYKQLTLDDVTNLVQWIFYDISVWH